MPLVKTEKGEYNILDPEKLKYAERDEFIKSLCFKEDLPEVPVESSIVSIWEAQHQFGLNAKVKVNEQTLRLAQDYIRYRDKGARLPKFSKWACGMFKDDKVLAKDLATAGKYVESNSSLFVSADMIDLLRNADTPHFTSCLAVGMGYEKVTQAIVEKCPGIAIAYVDDDGTPPKMRGRCWVHHAQRVDNGADVAVVCTKWGGTVGAEQVVDVLRSKGVEAYVGGSYGNQSNNGLAVNFINCFNEPIHHDMYTWVKGFKVQNY